MQALALSPHGVLYLDLLPEEPAPSVAIAPDVAARIERAFAAGPGAGLLHLGAVEAESVLPPAHAFFRELARDFVTALCAEPALEDLRDAVDLAPRPERLDELARAAPPMKGAEYVTSERASAGRPSPASARAR